MFCNTSVWLVYSYFHNIFIQNPIIFSCLPSRALDYYYTFLQSRLTIRQNCFTHSAYRGHHFLPFHHKCSPFAKTINRHSITTRHWAKLSTVSKTDRHWVKWIAYRRNGSSIVNNILTFQQNPACIFRQSEKHIGNDQNISLAYQLCTIEV